MTFRSNVLSNINISYSNNKNKNVMGILFMMGDKKLNTQ